MTFIQNPAPLFMPFGWSSGSTWLTPPGRMLFPLNCSPYHFLPDVSGIFCASIHCKMCIQHIFFSPSNILSPILSYCLSRLPGVFLRWDVVLSSRCLPQWVALPTPGRQKESSEHLKKCNSDDIFILMFVVALVIEAT